MANQNIMKSIETIDTPALILDLDVLDANIAKIIKETRTAGVEWRPHIKASKAPDLAKRLIASGAIGVTSAKVSEAEAMVDGGVEDILIANEVVGCRKISRLINLAKRSRLCVAVDDSENLHEIAAAMDSQNTSIDVLVDINVNMNRCGVPPKAAPALAALVNNLHGVNLRGLMGYEGHVGGMEPEEKDYETAVSGEILSKARKLVEEAGMTVNVTSGGSTSNYLNALSHGHLTELQAGGGVLMDLQYADRGICELQHALLVVTQIISVVSSEYAIGDAGFKAIGIHTGLPKVSECTDLNVLGLNAEHIRFRLAPGTSIRPKNRIKLIPSYSDSTVMLHRKIHVVRNGIVCDIWPITAAGMTQ